jgi:hypothetical protein
MTSELPMVNFPAGRGDECSMTMVTRRQFGAVVGAAATSLTLPGALGQTPNEDEFEGMEAFGALPDGYNTNPVLSPNFGSATPPQDVRRVADILLRGAPIRCRPIDVAFYFENLRQGRVPDAIGQRLATYLRQANKAQLIDTNYYRLFAYDWERNNYFNPVVVQFLIGIGQTAYAGDATAWCAAFANWCISRSKASDPSTIAFGGNLLRLGTGSASSGSFRCFGQQTSSPRLGDLVVWAKVGTQNQVCPVNLNNSQGHVGFFVSEVTSPNGNAGYRVLGGNQGFRRTVMTPTSGPVGQRDVAQAVSYRTIGRTFSDRTFHSFRTATVLQSVS